MGITLYKGYEVGRNPLNGLWYATPREDERADRRLKSSSREGIKALMDANPLTAPKLDPWELPRRGQRSQAA